MLLMVYMWRSRSSRNHSTMINERRGRSFSSGMTPVATNNLKEVEKKTVESEPPGARSLNAHFVFQGQSYDAYEVLGVPAGCSYQMAEASLHKVVLDLEDSHKKELFKTALQTLKSLR